MQSDEARLTTEVADVQSFRDPRSGQPTSVDRNSVDVPGSSTSVDIDVASQTGLVLGVSYEEDTLDGVKAGSGQPLQGVDGSGGSLGVSLEEETVTGVGGEGRLDFAYDISRTRS